ncbi:MAG: amidohydrolase family protein [Planctomycetota bacterium]
MRQGSVLAVMSSFRPSLVLALVVGGAVAIGLEANAASPNKTADRSAGQVAAEPSGPLVIQAREIYVGDGSVIEGGVVLVRDGKIELVAGKIEVPSGARVIAVEKGTITPGFIDPNAVAGIVSSYSYAEHSSEVIPQMRVLDAINLLSDDFMELALSGVTTVFVAPDTASVIATRGAILKTGEVARVIVPEQAVLATMGSDPTFRGTYNSPPSRFGTVTFLNRRPTTRMGTVWVFRKAFYDAREFAATGKAPDRENDPAALAVLANVLEGSVPLRIQARMALDIETAFRLADEFGLRFTLVEPIEAFKVLDMIQERRTSVVFGPLFLVPRGPRAAAGEADEFCLSTPATLVARGLEVALSAQEQSGEAGLRTQAIFAIRYGMPEQEALKAVTSTPAKILGLDRRLGTVAAGKDADLVVWSGKPFDVTSKVAYAVIDGRVVESERKQP